MLQLKINTTRQISTADLRMACDPPLHFKVRAYFGFEVSQEMVHWQEAGRKDAAEAARILSRIFVSVSQSGESYPLTSSADVLALRDAVEADSPGEGDGFICTLLLNFVSNHYSFFTKAESDSADSLTESNTGDRNGLTP